MNKILPKKQNKFQRFQGVLRCIRIEQHMPQIFLAKESHGGLYFSQRMHNQESSIHRNKDKNKKKLEQYPKLQINTIFHQIHSLKHQMININTTNRQIKSRGNTEIKKYQRKDKQTLLRSIRIRTQANCKAKGLKHRPSLSELTKYQSQRSISLRQAMARRLTKKIQQSKRLKDIMINIQ